MKIVQADQTELKGSPKTRGGTGHSSKTIFDCDILDRDGSRPDNFYFGISYSKEGEFSAPRHRHIFEQFRFMIEGESEFAEGMLSAGVLGYFPEGAYYGPQESAVGTVAVLQFGGPSGQGYIERKVAKAAHSEMLALNTGYFEDGTYYRNEGGEGPAVQDGNEAIFEYIRKQAIVYPVPQYKNPILIDTNAFPWSPVEETPGTSEKVLGVFSSCRTRAACYRLEPDASFVASGRGIYLVLSGKGTLEGDRYGPMTCVYLEESESATFVASEPTEMLLMGLPLMGLMSTP